jgi:hypothetical protein
MRKKRDDGKSGPVVGITDVSIVACPVERRLSSRYSSHCVRSGRVVKRIVIQDVEAVIKLKEDGGGWKDEDEDADFDMQKAGFLTGSGSDSTAS